jgi:adenine phosphoribosyltransferase
VNDPRLAQIEALIRDVADYPKPGIVFKDITPVLASPQGMSDALDLMAERCAHFEAEVIASPEARGFVFGVPLALRLGCGFVPVRKKGKLPWRTIEESYDLEYGSDTLAIHEDAVSSGPRVLIVDDLLATGGTVGAAQKLIEKGGGSVVGAAFLIELGFLAGRERLDGVPVESLLHYD